MTTWLQESTNENNELDVVVKYITMSPCTVNFILSSALPREQKTTSCDLPLVSNQN